MTSSIDDDAENLPYQLLAHASHELRTPLNGMIGTLVELLDTGLDDRQRQLAANAWRGAGQLQALIDELFDLSLLESDSLPMKPARFDLPSMLKPVVNLLTDIAQSHGVELQTHWSVPPLRAYADPHRLQQLIAAVVRTAVRQHPYCAIALVLNATAGSDGHCRLQILLNGSRTPLQPDTAAPSWRFATLLARQLQARIEVAGETGAPQIRIDMQLQAAADVLTGLRVLFVSAHDEERTTLVKAMREHGLRADGFSGAANALIALRQAASERDPYRVALLDEQMHAIDGEMLGHAIMAEPIYRDTLLVLRSVLAPDDVPRPGRAGFAAVLAAPTAPEALIATIERICADRQPPYAQSSACASRCRVLVVDDQASDRQVTERALAAFGCTVETARDGSEAVTMQRSRVYDLIMVDCRLPGLDRYVKATRMLEGRHAGHPPIIGCTADLMQAERHACVDSGLDDVVAKPLHPFLLRHLLEKWLSPRGSRPAAAPGADQFEAVSAMLGQDFDELAVLFMADSPKRLEELRRSMATHDASQLAKAAHAFSGSTASIGAHGLSVLCKNLELEARAGRMTQAGMALHAVEQEYARVAARLEGMLATPRK